MLRNTIWGAQNNFFIDMAEFIVVGRALHADHFAPLVYKYILSEHRENFN